MELLRPIGPACTGPLAEAEQAVASMSTTPIDVAPCPLAKAPAKEPEVRPRRVLLWHLTELGGGPFLKARGENVLAAYAAIIAALDCDVCALTGLRHHDPPAFRESRTADGQPCLVLAEPSEHVGLRQAKALVTQLRAASGAAWQLVEQPTYHRDETACFLYRAGDGVALDSVEIVVNDESPEPAVPPWLVATFRFPDFPAPVPIAVPIAALVPEDLSLFNDDQARKPAGDRPAVRDVGRPCVYALSVGDDLAGTTGLLNHLRAAIDAVSEDVPTKGSVLEAPLWPRTTAERSGWLANLDASVAADVDLVDRHMHWEALEPLAHPDALDEVRGRLADCFMLGGGGATITLTDQRVVDLVRAAGDVGGAVPAASGAAGPTDHLPEDGALAGVWKAHVAARSDLPWNDARASLGPDGEPAQPEPAPAEGDLDTRLARRLELARQLSRHWPIISRLQPR